MAKDTRPDPVKEFGQPDIPDFGPGEVGLFDFGWTDYLWTDLEAGKSWIVRLKNADVAVVAVLAGEVEVQDEKGKHIRDVHEGELFATHDRIIKAKTKSRLFAAPLFEVRPMGASTPAGSNGDRGGPVFL